MASTSQLKEGSYTLPDGRQVRFTDDAIRQLTSDLYQYLDKDYKGTPSVPATRLETILQNLAAGKPLASDEWDIIDHALEAAGEGFREWQQQGRDSQDASVPEGTGRLVEALALLPEATLRKLREQDDPDAPEHPSRNAKDQASTAPHLLDTTLHDMAHARQHAERLKDPAVQRDPTSVAFNAEHLLTHLESSRNHASRLGQHLARHGADARTFQAERGALQQLREVEPFLTPDVVKLLREGSPVPPPSLRPADPESPMRCGGCKMFYSGTCWGYNNIPVRREWVCDSYSADPSTGGLL